MRDEWRMRTCARRHSKDHLTQRCNHRYLLVVVATTDVMHAKRIDVWAINIDQLQVLAERMRNGMLRKQVGCTPNHGYIHIARSYAACRCSAYCACDQDAAVISPD